MTSNPSHRRDAGYTLTELLVVLVILSLIAAAIAPRIIGRLDSSKVRAANLQLETLAASVDLFFIDTGRYPTRDEGLDALISRPDGIGAWDGPYIRSSSNLIDPWGNPFLYLAPERGQSAFILRTLGSDGAEGGEGNAADLQFPDFGQRR